MSNLVLDTRKTLGLTRDEMARALGISKRQIYRYEAGVWMPQSVELALYWLDEHPMTAKLLAQREGA